MLRRIGGGRRYEAMLVWDEHRLAVLVAKVLRPDQARDAARAAGRSPTRPRCCSGSPIPSSCARSAPSTDGQFPHLVLEHLDGPTLDELLAREGPLALEQLLPLALHVASALHYLAGEGVVHLDVKPSNIVMGAPPRLIDLSVARTVEEAAKLRVPIGTDGLHGARAARPGRSPRAAGGRLRPGGHAVHRADRRQAAGRRPAAAPHAARAVAPSCTPGWTRTPPRARPPPSSRARSSRSSPRSRGG